VQPGKVEAVAEIKEKFESVDDFIVTDYRGLSVGQITELRGKLRETGSEYKVVKNRYAKIAFKELGHEGLDEILVGPTAIAMIKGESGPAAKALFGFAKDSPVAVRGGLVGGTVFDVKQLEAFSKLPTRIELIAMLMSTMNAPVQNLVYVLNAPVEKLARTLKAVADQKAAE
jgi:large subunit ribosomal protein L10